jgi:hypothetical protein
MRIVMGTVADLKVERLTMMGGLGAATAGPAGNGVGRATATSAAGGRLVAANEQIKAASGIDLLGAAQNGCRVRRRSSIHHVRRSSIHRVR